MRLRTSSNASSVFSLDRSRPLQGKVAVITGASKGIGRAAALALANEGCRLVLVAAHSTNLLSGVAQDCVVLAAEVFEVVCDVRSEESVEDLLTVIKDKFGSVDILVNCAGIAQKGLVPSWQFSLEVLETDLVGLMRVTYKMLEVMKGPGSIVNIGSIASANIIGDGHGTADYSAAKAGVNAFSHCLFEKIRDQGIKCAVIHPGCARLLYRRALSEVVSNLAKLCQHGNGRRCRFGSLQIHSTRRRRPGHSLCLQSKL